MRLDAGTRWALSDKFELTAEALAYFGYGSGDAGYGIGRIRLGSKYIFEHWPFRNYETSLAITGQIPTGHPPVDMTDGSYHFAPTLVVQHNWFSRPRLTTFAGVGADIIGRSTVDGTFDTNQPHDHAISFIAGAVYDMGQIKWTMTGTYATTSYITRHSNNFYYLQPGMLWYVPSRFTFHSKTQWIVGLSARGTWGPDGFDFGLNSRLRAEITFRQLMEKFHKTTDNPEHVTLISASTHGQAASLLHEFRGRLQTSQRKAQSHAPRCNAPHAASAATKSSATMPQPPGQRCSREMPSGLRMSKKRNSPNPSSTTVHSGNRPG